MERSEFNILAASLRPLLVRRATAMLRDVEEADDVAQETLIKLWEIHTELDEMRSVQAMAAVIARNKCVDRLRRRGFNVCPLDMASEMPDSSLNPLQVMEREEYADEANQLLGTLPAGMREVLMLRHMHGLELDEIAAELGMQPGAVRVALSRARKKIREIYERQNINRS